MAKKLEIIVTNANKPSEAAVKAFHKRVHNFMQQTTGNELKKNYFSCEVDK